MNKRTPLLVAIVGGSGAGKTWLAKKLHAALSPDAARLSLDDFYRDHSHLPPERRARVNFDHPQAIDWQAVEECLEDVRAGREVRIPHYNFHTHSRLSTERVLAPQAVVIIDGLWLLRRASVRRVFGMSVFIECPSRTRRSRRLARDLRSRGRARASILEQWCNTVEPMYARFVAPQMKWADMVLHHDFNERDVRRLARELRERLNVLRSLHTATGE